MKNIPNTKYIHRNGYSFYIMRYVNGKNTYFGSYSSLIVALMIRDELESNGWRMKYETKYNNPEKYINITGNGKYRISRTIGNKIYIYGVYNTLKEAHDVKIALIGAGWPYVPRNRRKNDLPKYITPNKTGSYTIQKMIKNKTKIFGCFKTLKFAVEERDYLLKHNWKYEDLDLIDDRVDGKSYWLGVEVNV